MGSPDVTFSSGSLGLAHNPQPTASLPLLVEPLLRGVVVVMKIQPTATFCYVGLGTL